MSKIIIETPNGLLSDSAYNLIEVGETEKSLEYSEIGSWNKPGKLGYTLIDTGNGLIFHDHFLKKKYNLDYCNVIAFRILLDLFQGNVEYQMFEKVKKK